MTENNASKLHHFNGFVILDDTKTPPPHQFDHMLMRKLSAFKHGHVIDVDRATGSTLLKVSRLGGS